MERKQDLTIDDKTGIITLTNTLDYSELARENYEARKTDGFTNMRLGRRLASIPMDILKNDPDGLIYLAAPPNSPERRIALIKVLEKFPDFKTCSGKI
jgi:hypothetical protein